MSLNLDSILDRTPYGFVTKEEIFAMVAEIRRLRTDVAKRVDDSYRAGEIQGRADGLRFAYDIMEGKSE